MEPPESRSHYHRAVVIGVLSLYLGLPTISVILRLWSRKLGRSKYWYDDYFMIFALVCKPTAPRVMDWMVDQSRY